MIVLTKPLRQIRSVSRVKPLRRLRSKNVYVKHLEGNGAPGGTRTPDLLVRSQTLYPTELQAHNK